jgi:hypothetical protein
MLKTIPKKTNKITTFRLKPKVLAQFHKLERVLNLNRTEVLNKAIDQLESQIIAENELNPLTAYVGSIGDDLSVSTKQFADEKLKQSVLQTKKYNHLKKMFN